MKIAVAGLGYVGISNAILLARHHEVVSIDISKEKVHLISSGVSPIQDSEIERHLNNKDISLKATLDPVEAYTDAAYVIIATPTNYDPETNYFNTESVESVVSQVHSINPEAIMGHLDF